MSDNWIQMTEGALTLTAVGIATLLMPGRILRFLRTLNNDRVLYPTSPLRDMGVLFVVGFAAGIVGTLALDWMFIKTWKPGSLLDVSHVLDGDFTVVVIWQIITMIPVLIAVVLLSEHRAKKRLQAAPGGPPDLDRMQQVSKIHATGDSPIDNPFVLPGAVLILSDWALARWAGGVPFAFSMHLVAWALPIGLAFASLRLIGIRI